MAADMTNNTQQRLYEDFMPAFNWVIEEEIETLVLHLPGFKKEQLRVQIDSAGNLKISGERHLDGNRWSRFRKEFRVQKHVNINDIFAKFIGGLLYVKLPKKINQGTIHDGPAALPQDQAPNPQKIEKKSDQTQATTGSTSTKPEKDHVTGTGYGENAETGKQEAGTRGFMLKLKKHRIVVLGAAVVVTAVVALGVYAACRLASTAQGEDGI